MKAKINRYLHYNIGRIRKAEQFDRQRADFLLKVVPLLLHCNHPELPGYIDTPLPAWGIARYLPEKRISEPLYRRYFPLAPPLTVTAATAPAAPQIHSLKTIGSIGTVAQSAKSDCDYWLSVKHHELTRDGLRQLEKKCRAIAAWAATLNIEIHFFPMDIAQTRENKFHSATDDESAGSALKLLLKDELFRSHILVAGKIPLWWLIPPGLSEAEYQAFSRKLQHSGAINPDMFVDLGYLSTIPRQEIFGACLWQMNKSLESPYKSVIKFAYLELLLAHEGQSLPFLSDKIKCLVTFPEKIADPHDADMALAAIDPYLLLARDLVQFYSTAPDSGDRARLIQTCLFLKTLEGLQPQESAHRGATDSAIKRMAAWHLLPDNYKELRNLKNWRHKQLVHIGIQVHEYLIATYKRLRVYFKNLPQDSGLAISERDVAVLGRKLFTFYQDKPNKVPYLRSLSAAEMARSDITFHVGGSGGSPWYYAFQGSFTLETIRGHNNMVIRRELSLITLVTWLLINGIMTPETKLHVTKNFLGLALVDIVQLTNALRTALPPVHFAHIPAAHLLEPEKIVHALIVANLDKRPVKDGSHLQTTVISTNSYGEYFVQEYTTLEQIKKATTLLLTKHYVSRWNNNLHYYIPPQAEAKKIAGLLGCSTS